MWLLFEFYLSTDIDNIPHRKATVYTDSRIVEKYGDQLA